MQGSGGRARADAMAKETPRPEEGAGQGASSHYGPVDSTRSPAQKQTHPAPAPALDLVGLRERLLEARRRLVERIAEDFPADRRFPDSGWTRMLADIQAAIMAVDAIVAEASP